jgi:hypothetical protein
MFFPNPTTPEAADRFGKEFSVLLNVPILFIIKAPPEYQLFELFMFVKWETSNVRV